MKSCIMAVLTAVMVVGVALCVRCPWKEKTKPPVIQRDEWKTDPEFCIEPVFEKHRERDDWRVDLQYCLDWEAKKIIKEKVFSPDRIGVYGLFSRSFDSNVAGHWETKDRGERYESRLKISNAHGETFSIDSVETLYTNGMGRLFDANSFQTKQRLTFIDREKETPKSLKVAYQGAEFTNSPTAMLNPTVLGKSVTIANVVLWLNGKTIAADYHCVLPPIFQIPNEIWAKTENDFLEIQFLAHDKVPVPSGVFEEKAVEQAFETATATSHDARLVSISPGFALAKSDGSVWLLGWTYNFSSSRESFSVPVTDLATVTNRLPLPKKSKEFLSKDILGSCIVEVNAVEMIFSTIKELKKDKPKFELLAALDNGKVRPIWDTGYLVKGINAYMFADTGQIVFKDGNSYKPFPGIIWNEVE